MCANRLFEGIDEDMDDEQFYYDGPEDDDEDADYDVNGYLIIYIFSK